MDEPRNIFILPLIHSSLQVPGLPRNPLVIFTKLLPGDTLMVPMGLSVRGIRVRKMRRRRRRSDTAPRDGVHRHSRGITQVLPLIGSRNRTSEGGRGLEFDGAPGYLPLGGELVLVVLGEGSDGEEGGGVYAVDGAGDEVLKGFADGGVEG